MTSKCLVTGASGFLGRHLVRYLKSLGRQVIGIGGPYASRLDSEVTAHVNLVDGHAVDVMFETYQPDYLFHLAGYNGGIQFNLDKPADIFHDNVVMGMNVIDACHRHHVAKVLSVVASCAYPAKQEEYYDDTLSGEAYTKGPRQTCFDYDFFNGPPHQTVACHGYAKRNLQLASGFYREQYGLNAVCVCPTTLYGPGDSYDPQRTKVMGGMVKRFVDAKRKNLPSVTCWGSGAASREFLYVKDAAGMLADAMAEYNDSNEPLNLGTGQEVTIKELAEMVSAGVGYSGRIEWDTTKPDGQLRKRLDLTKMRQVLPNYIYQALESGIAFTVADYQSRFPE